MPKPQAYIAGALTNLNGDEADQIKAMYEQIGQLCSEMGLKPYIPHQHTDPIRHALITPREVYLTDRDRVARSAVVIALADRPSLGVGIELEVAACHGVEVILLYRLGVPVSRMALGNPAIVGVIAYSEWSQALAQLRSLLRSRGWGRADPVASGGTVGPVEATIWPSSLFLWEELAVRFLVPLRHNDGRAVDQELFLDLEQALAQWFGGWTRFDHVHGGWWFDGRLWRDDLVCYEVVLKREDFSLREFVHLKHVLAQRFEQVEIFMVGSPARLL
jgi:hypothetical protein